MVSINSHKDIISTALCYKDKLLVSFVGESSLQLYSLGGVPYPYLSTIDLKQSAKSLDWGVKKDLIIACTEQTIYILKVTNTQFEVICKRDTNCCKFSTFSYLNDFCVAGNETGLVRLFDSDSLKDIGKYSHNGSVTGIDISSENDLMASTSVDGTCAIYSTKYKKVIRNLQFAERDFSKNLPFFGCKFSKSGDSLFTTSSDDYAYITQWDMQDFLPIVSHRVHSAPITVFSMSLDGFFLGLGCQDGTVKIFNTRTMDFERNNKDFSGSVSAISFTYESRHMIACSEAEIKNVFNTRGEGFFSKASKIWVVSMLLFWIYLYLNTY